MYGMIHKSIRDMVTTVHGEAVWERIAREAGVEDDHFLSLRAYDDEICYSLVAACAQVLNVSAAQCLEDFGRFWVLVTAAQHYGNMLRGYGNTTIDLLAHLNQLHERIASTFVGYRPPSFSTERLTDGECRLHYISGRSGLTPFVSGLVSGLAEFFDEEVDILSVEPRAVDVGEYTVFHLSFRPGVSH